VVGQEDECQFKGFNLNGEFSQLLNDELLAKPVNNKWLQPNSLSNNVYNTSGNYDLNGSVKIMDNGPNNIEKLKEIATPEINVRSLLENTEALSSSKTYYTVSPTPSHLNGNGLAGFWILVLFLFPVLIGSYALMSIFVSPKFADVPIRIKIME
jgi:hypothetical protein